MSRQLVLAAVLVAALGSCKGTTPAKFAPGQAVMLEGEVGAGVECPILVLAGDRRVSLAGGLGRFVPGDRVCVRGTVAEMSMCMAGEATIEVLSIAPADSCR